MNEFDDLERRVIKVSQEEWDWLQEWLGEPAEVMPKLSKLLEKHKEDHDAEESETSASE